MSPGLILAMLHGMLPTRIARWRSVLLTVTLGGLLFALLSGSALLFFGMPRARREYWVIVHWLAAMVALVPYALYQLRHWQRVRLFGRPTHYRVGLHAFFMMCGTVLTGLLLVLSLTGGTRLYSAVDLAHIFFGFVFALLIAAHLTLVAVLTVTQVPPAEAPAARAAVRWALVAFALLAIAGLGVAITSS